MRKLLLTFEGRISRSELWLALFYHLLVSAAVGVIMVGLWQIIPGSVGDDGSFHVEGAAATPYIALSFATLAFFVWSGICVGAKRYHDRNKSGWWLLIQFVPIIGSVWYFIEVFCLRGTVGANRFGPDPLAVLSLQTAN